jgi:hypothetical protein
MNRYFPQERVVFLALDTSGGVFAVLGGDIPRHTGNARCFLLGAFQNDLNSIAFLSHCYLCFLKRERKDSAFQIVDKV